MLVASNYHYIRTNFNTPYPGIYGLTPDMFEKQLLVLSQTGTFVSAQQIIDHINNETSLPEKAIIITFDDGLAEQFDLALPVLKKLDIPAIFFINTQNIVEKKVSTVHKTHLLLTSMPFNIYQGHILEKALDLFGKSIDSIDKEKAVAHYSYDDPERACFKYFLNFGLNILEQEKITGDFFQEYFSAQEEDICKELYMSESQIKELSDLGYLGTHSHKHIPLGLCTAEEIMQDLSISMQHLADITGNIPGSVSYPYGSAEACGPTVSGIAKKLGLSFGFTMERAGNTDFSNPLALARFDCNDMPGGKKELFPKDSFFDNIPVSNLVSEGV